MQICIIEVLFGWLSRTKFTAECREQSHRGSQQQGEAGSYGIICVVPYVGALEAEMPSAPACLRGIIKKVVMLNV